MLNHCCQLLIPGELSAGLVDTVELTMAVLVVEVVEVGVVVVVTGDDGLGVEPERLEGRPTASAFSIDVNSSLNEVSDTGFVTDEVCDANCGPRLFLDMDSIICSFFRRVVKKLASRQYLDMVPLSKIRHFSACRAF